MVNIAISRSPVVHDDKNTTANEGIEKCVNDSCFGRCEVIKKNSYL